MSRRSRFVENYRGHRIVERWTEMRTIDQGTTKHEDGYWTDGMSGFPRTTIREVRQWIDEQEHA